MAVSDVLITVLAVPRQVLEILLGPSRWLIDGLLGSVLCKSVHFFQDITVGVSILTTETPSAAPARVQRSNMWECDWDPEVKSNEDLKQFLASYEMVEPLDPRDAFFGERTNAVRLHHVVNGDQGERNKLSM